MPLISQLVGRNPLYCAPSWLCYINPVKRGLVTRVHDWPFSSFRRDVAAGLFPQDRAGDFGKGRRLRQGPETSARPKRRNKAIAPFCNGPRLVNPFLRHPIAGSRFCPGSARGRHLMGSERIGRPIYERVFAMPLGAMRSDLIRRPGEGTSLRGAWCRDPPEIS
jgi:hypothetical protein